MLEAVVSDPSIWSSFRVRVVQCDAFCSTPNAGYRKAKMHLLCPVFKLTFYLKAWAPSDARSSCSFASGDCISGKTLSNKCLASWLCDCISQDYRQVGLDPPSGVHAYSCCFVVPTTMFIGMCVLYMHSGIMDKDMSAHTVLPPGHVRLLIRVCVCEDTGLVKVVTGCTGVS